jgi:uncharacterized coiled-coil protein SlyX
MTDKITQYIIDENKRLIAENKILVEKLDDANAIILKLSQAQESVIPPPPRFNKPPTPRWKIIKDDMF